MKKTIFLATLSLCFFAVSTGKSDRTEVYVCSGKLSKKYHFSKDCNGLKNCDVSLKTLPINDARSLGKVPCNWKH